MWTVQMYKINDDEILKFSGRMAKNQEVVNEERENIYLWTLFVRFYKSRKLPTTPKKICCSNGI